MRPGTRVYNRAVIAGLVLLLPPLVFWGLVLVYSVFGIGRSLVGVFAGLETTPAGSVLIVTAVIGCPFFALPLTVIGRWLARVKGQRGVHLANAVLVASVLLLGIGLVLPLALR